jgi:hypothetical protein
MASAKRDIARDPRHMLLAVAFGLGSMLAAPPALAEHDECIRSYEQTQTLRRAGQLREAREQAVQCARDTCPALLAKDCAQWMSEIEESIPTVVFDVRTSSGEELTNVRVLADGKPLVEQLDGKAVPIDVGPHVFRFEAKDGKRQPIEQKILVREGERNRKIQVTLATNEPPPEPAADPVPVMAWVFGGIAVASLAGGTAFAIMGSAKESDLDACRPSCSPDAVNSVSSSYAVADILLTAGVVSAVAAAWAFLSRPTKAPAAAALFEKRGAALFHF